MDKELDGSAGEIMKPTMKASRNTLILVALAVSFAISVLWIAGNIHHVPQYGDTVEYLSLATTLKVDQYRTILFPLYLHLFGISSETSKQIPWCLLVQLALSFLASLLLAYAMFRDFSPTSMSRMRSVLTIFAAGTYTAGTPLLAHLSLSLMSDSLACSFTMATVACLSLTLDQYKSGKPMWQWDLATVLCIFLMSASRVDKLYLSITLAFVSLTWLYRSGISARRPGLSSSLCRLGLVLCIPMAATIWLNHSTQVFNKNRPPLDLSSLLFNRVTWPNLEKVYPYLSDDAHKFISSADATQFDSHNNYVYPMLTRLLSDPAAGKHVINEITAKTFQHFPLQIVGKTLFDITKYALPCLAFPLELLSILPISIGTDWTYTRMAMFTPGLTLAWLIVSFGILLLIQLPLAASQARGNWKQWASRPTIFISLVTILVNSLLFGLEAGMDAYVRYALPAFSLQCEAIVLLSLIRVFASTRSAKVGESSLT
jgi:hypothetical protein